MSCCYILKWTIALDMRLNLFQEKFYICGSKWWYSFARNLLWPFFFERQELLMFQFLFNYYIYNWSPFLIAPKGSAVFFSLDGTQRLYGEILWAKFPGGQKRWQKDGVSPPRMKKTNLRANIFPFPPKKTCVSRRLFRRPLSLKLGSGVRLQFP